MSKDGKVVIDIEADDSGFKDTVDDVEKEAKDAADGLDDLGDSAKEAGDGFGVAEVAVGSFVANAVTNLISSIGNAVSSFFELSESTREAREDMAKLETAFSTNGHSTEAASKAYEDFYAILGESDRSVEAVNHLAELTKNEEELSKWSTIAAGVTAKFGDSLPIEGLTEAANETAKVGVTTGVLADALNWASADSAVFEKAFGGNERALTEFNGAIKGGLPVEEAFTAALSAMATEEERSAAITETLNGIYSDAAAEYNELTASTQEARRATSEMEAAQAEIGAALEPVTTAWVKLKADAFEKLVPVVQKVVEFMQKLSDWATENPGKMEAIKAVVIGLTTAFVALSVALNITKAIDAVKNAFVVLNAVLAANPVGIVVAAIAGLVAAFIYLWNNCDAFREFWLNLWDRIKEIAGAAGEWLSEFFTETIPEFFSNLFSSIGEFFSNIWSAVSEFFSSLFSSIGEFFTSIYNALVAFFNDPFYYIGYALGYIIGLIVDWANDVWDFLTVTVPKIIDDVVTFFSELPDKIWTWLVSTVNKVKEWALEMAAKSSEAATDFIDEAITVLKELPGKVWSWLSNTIQKAATFVVELGAKGLEAAKELLSNIVEGAKEIPGKMLEIGKNIVDGVWQGILDAKDLFFKNVKGFFSGLVDGAKAALEIKSPSKKFRYVGEMSAAGYKVGWDDNITDAEKAMQRDLGDLTARVQATVSAENTKAGSTVRAHDTGIFDLARAVGTQTAGIASLASEYRRGTGSMRPIILELNGRELGRAVVDVSSAEETRVGTRLAFA